MIERKCTVVSMARQLSCGRANVYKIFEKYSIDTELLMKISVTLDYDFFSLYSRELNNVYLYNNFALDIVLVERNVLNYV